MDDFHGISIRNNISSLLTQLLTNVIFVTVATSVFALLAETIDNSEPPRKPPFMNNELKIGKAGSRQRLDGIIDELRPAGVTSYNERAQTKSLTSVNTSGSVKCQLLLIN